MSQSLALLTDLYQLTMAAGYWKSGRASQRAAFHLFFRKNPFDGGFAICAGLEPAIDYLHRLQFGAEEIDYLASMTCAEGTPLFDKDFLQFLAREPLQLDVDAVPEGTVVFPNEPLLRVTGPLWQAQLVETALLTIINFQTLIATKAARVCHAAAGDPVIEFGLRRAQGIDGALSASRAAYIGGCAGTSNVLAGKTHGIPVRGTHAHSWVMSFESELEAFETYARALPHNVIFLIDTYDAIEGTRNAIKAAEILRSTGHKLLGVRLDSGDLAWQSIEARRMLDEAGWPDAKVLASNDLDEEVIESLKQQGARIAAWGVGTKLVTGGTQSALGGVYKLGAVDRGKGWEPCIKVSEQKVKINIPGLLQTRRFEDEEGQYRADVIMDAENEDGLEPSILVDPNDDLRRRKVEPGWKGTDLLVPVLRNGKLISELPPLAAIQKRTQDQLQRLHPAHLRRTNPHEYPVGLSPELNDRREALIRRLRHIEDRES